MLEHALDAVHETVQAVVVAVVRVRARAHVVVVRTEVLGAVRMLCDVGGARWGWMLGEAGGEAEFADAGFDCLAGVNGLGFGGLYFAHHVGYDAAEEGVALLAAVADGRRAQGHGRECELHTFVSDDVYERI